MATCEKVRMGCGGCQLLALPYPQQLAQKQRQVVSLLGGLGPVLPILGMEYPFHYRCKVTATFTAGPKGELQCGIYAQGSHRVVPVSSCLLQDEEAERAVQAILQAARQCRYAAYDEDRGTGLVRHVLVRRGLYTGQLLAVLVTAHSQLPGSRRFAGLVRAACPSLTTLVQNINPRRTSVVLGSQQKVLFGPGAIEDELCGYTFRISPTSFYQVNPRQTERLYRCAVEFAGLTGREQVLDAYCGTGTIGLLAAQKAGQVVGVELNPAAVRDAHVNARRNQVRNIHFETEDATLYMEQLARQGTAPDIVLMDPPRTGSTPAFLAALCLLAPRRVVYISCDPVTQARDARCLAQNGYVLRKAQPVDFFPHTQHIECIALFERGSAAP